MPSSTPRQNDPYREPITDEEVPSNVPAPQGESGEEEQADPRTEEPASPEREDDQKTTPPEEGVSSSSSDEQEAEIPKGFIPPTETSPSTTVSAKPHTSLSKEGGPATTAEKPAPHTMNDDLAQASSSKDDNRPSPQKPPQQPKGVQKQESVPKEEQVASTPEEVEKMLQTDKEGVTNTPLPEQEKGNIPTVRTFESDAAEAMNTEKVSKARIAVAEADKKGGGVKTKRRPLGSNHRWINAILILVLLVATAGVLFYVVVLEGTGEPPLYAEMNPDELFFVNERREVSTNGMSPEAFRDTLTSFTDELALEEGRVANIYFTQGEEELRRFIEIDELKRLLGLSAPASFERTLGEGYMVGYYGEGGRSEPFFIFTIRDFDIAFSGALTWEETMVEDFEYLFSAEEVPDTATHVSTTTSTSTDEGETPEENAVTTTPVEDLRFRDEVLQNIDVRLLEQDEVTKLLYAFPNRETLIITTSISAFEEVLSRLTQSQFTR